MKAMSEEMEVISRLVVGSRFRNTLVDIVCVYKGRLGELSPEAKTELKRGLFGEKGGKPHGEDMLAWVWDELHT